MDHIGVYVGSTKVAQRRDICSHQSIADLWWRTLSSSTGWQSWQHITSLVIFYQWRAVFTSTTWWMHMFGFLHHWHASHGWKYAALGRAPVFSLRTVQKNIVTPQELHQEKVGSNISLCWFSHVAKAPKEMRGSLVSRCWAWLGPVHVDRSISHFSLGYLVSYKCWDFGMTNRYY